MTYTEQLTQKQRRIQEEIQKLTAIETYLFDELNKASDTSTDNTERQNEIEAHIQSVKQSRIKLINDLSNLFDTATGELSYNTRHLTSQLAMDNQLTDELSSINEKYEKLKAEKNNKTRLAQIGEYEFEKNKEHRSILKTIVYASFFILIISYLNSIMFLPDMLTKTLIVIITSITLLLLVQRFYWNFRRDNIDYSKFKQSNTLPNVVPDAASENTFKLSNLLGFKSCEQDIDQLAQEAAERRAEGVAGFTNFKQVFPSQSTFFKKRVNKNNNTKNLQFSLL